MNPNDMKAQKAKLVGALAVLAALPALTTEQRAEFDSVQKQVEALNEQITRAEWVAGQQAGLARVEQVTRPGLAAPAARKSRSVIENPGFENVGELLYCARFEPNDSRVRALMEPGDGSSGGLMVPTVFQDSLQMVAPSAAVVRPRATIIPAGESPDAEFELPALNQQSGSNMYGGAAVTWIAEGGTIADTSVALRSVKWKAKKVAASTVMTNEMLRNWRASGAFIEALLRGALAAAEDVAFISGNGVGRPRGIIGCAAEKAVNRATASHITYADLVGMEAVLHEDMPAVWIASPSAIAELRVIKDAANRYIWTDGSADVSGSATQARPATLLGRPVIKSFRNPALGVKGDLQLCDLTKYIVKDGQALSVAASEHVYFTTDKTIVKALKSVDGGPWLDGPIAQEDGSTYSPFVALDVPA